VNATIHPYRHPAGGATSPDDVVRAVFPDGPAPSGAIVVEHHDGGDGTVVALWPDEAPSAGRTYRLADRMDGPAAGRIPLFAQLTWVNENGDPAVAKAAERGGRERIAPAIRDVDGLVGVLVFRSLDERILVIGLATGLETLAEVRRRIERTPLLPGEDRALLPGPDRVEVGRALRADVPAGVRS
jgi:hypothetical protein